MNTSAIFFPTRSLNDEIQRYKLIDIKMGLIETE
jgi:hypothetical protein